jgi:DNA mismatch endonuclease (patch repair protein)
MDRLSKQRRSWNMSRIRGKHTIPEKVVRSLLHRLGFRFRLHTKSLPGRPDIVLAKYKTVVFVHGCFWHRHRGCKNSTTPTNRRDFWLAKLEGNAARDKLHRSALQKLGWRVLVVWECEIESTSGNASVQMRLSQSLLSAAHRPNGVSSSKCLSVPSGLDSVRRVSMHPQAVLP